MDGEARGRVTELVILRRGGERKASVAWGIPINWEKIHKIKAILEKLKREL